MHHPCQNCFWGVGKGVFITECPNSFAQDQAWESSGINLNSGFFMPHSADFQVFKDIFVHFYTFSGFFLKIHSHACKIVGPTLKAWTMSWLSMKISLQCQSAVLDSIVIFLKHLRGNFAGVDKVGEQGAPLPGNDKENWGNHNIDVIGVWRGVLISKPCSWGRNHFIHPWNLVLTTEWGFNHCKAYKDVFQDHLFIKFCTDFPLKRKNIYYTPCML